MNLELRVKTPDSRLDATGCAWLSFVSWSNRTRSHKECDVRRHDFIRLILVWHLTTSLASTRRADKRLSGQWISQTAYYTSRCEREAGKARLGPTFEVAFNRVYDCIVGSWWTSKMHPSCLEACTSTVLQLPKLRLFQRDETNIDFM